MRHLFCIYTISFLVFISTTAKVQNTVAPHSFTLPGIKLPGIANTQLVTFTQEFKAYAGPIIDMHLHGYTEEEFWGPVPNPATGEISVKTADEHRQKSIEIMKRNNVVLAMVCGTTIQAALVWEEELPGGVLRGLYFEEPKQDLSSNKFLELVLDKKIDVLGEVGAQYAGYSPSDPVFEPYWTIAEQHNIPVGIHTGASFPGIVYEGYPNFRLRFGDPLLLEDMLARHPELKVYMMHAGAQFYENALNIMDWYPQVYVDISVLTWMPNPSIFLEKFLKGAKERDLLNRVMFGSDQVIWPEAIEMSINRVNQLNFLTLEEKANIFYNNAAIFLDLSEDVIARHQQK